MLHVYRDRKTRECQLSVRRHSPLLELFISELYLAAQQGTGEPVDKACRQVSCERDWDVCWCLLACGPLVDTGFYPPAAHLIPRCCCRWSSTQPIWHFYSSLRHFAPMMLQFYLSYCMFIKLCDFCLHVTANELENSEFFPHEVVYRCLGENFKNLSCKPSGRNDTQNISFLYHSFFSSVGLVPQKNTFRDHNLWSPYGIGQTIYIFMLWFVLSFFSSPNLSRRRLDVCHTSTHGVALERI